MVVRLVFFIMLCFSLPANANSGITADELRQIAGDAEREKRERSQRVQSNDLDSLLLLLEERSAKTPGLSNDAGNGVNPKRGIKPKSHDVAAGESVETTEVAASKQAPGIQTTNTTPARLTTRQQRNPSDAVNPLVAERATVTAPSPPQSSKHGVTQPIVSTNSVNSSRAPLINKPAHIYLAPPRVAVNNSAASSHSDAVIQKQRRFGISIGRWFSAHMNRDTTNADPGLIEIRTTEDIDGKFRKLPSGTMLFATKRYNSGTKRLDLQIIHGVLPDGEEFTLNALVYDESQIAGLHGIVIENNAAAVSSGVKRGMINAGRSLASTVTEGGAVGVILDSTVSSVADAKQAAAIATDAAPYTIHVSPQSVLVQVQETF